MNLFIKMTSSDSMIATMTAAVILGEVPTFNVSKEHNLLLYKMIECIHLLLITTKIQSLLYTPYNYDLSS